MDGGRSRTRLYNTAQPIEKKWKCFETPWREPKMFVISTIDENGKMDKKELPIYETVLCYELRKLGLFVERQKEIGLIYDNIKMDIGFRVDLIVEHKVIVELKSVQALSPVFFKILLTYLRLTKKKLGLLVNFNEALIKDGIRRVANGL